jgi:endonuclease G
VIKDGATPGGPDVLAFIYPQVGPGYSFRPYDHLRFLTTVDEIEEMTRIEETTSRGATKLSL